MSGRPGMVVRGKEHPVQGPMLAVGSKAPDFELTDNDWAVRKLSDYAGKVKILSVVPSLETSVCSAQTRRFNQEAAALSDKIVILTISADLPFTQKRWCGAEGIENVETLSSHRDMKFSDDYGVHDTEWRLNQRAVFVLDANDVIQLAEYIPVMGNEVDFDAALAKARELA
jgi:thiol peroxidase